MLYDIDGDCPDCGHPWRQHSDDEGCVSIEVYPVCGCMTEPQNYD